MQHTVESITLDILVIASYPLALKIGMKVGSITHTFMSCYVLD